MHSEHKNSGVLKACKPLKISKLWRLGRFRTFDWDSVAEDIKSISSLLAVAA